MPDALDNAGSTVDTVGQNQADHLKIAADAELKKVIGQRDELKAKIREIEERDKKASEDKLAAEGKLSELLTSTKAELEAERKKLADLSQKAEAYEKQQEELRTQLLAKVTDDDIRAVLAKAPLADIQKIVDKFTQEKPQPPAPKLQLGNPEEVRKQFKNADEYGAYLKKQGLAV